MPTISNEWLSPMGVATLLGVTHITVRNWIVSGKLGAVPYTLGKEKTAYAIYRYELRQLLIDNGYIWDGADCGVPVERIDMPLSDPEQAQAFATKRAWFASTYRPIQHVAVDRNVTRTRMANIVERFGVELLQVGTERVALKLINLVDVETKAPANAFHKRNGRGVDVGRDRDYRVHVHVLISKQTSDAMHAVADARGVTYAQMPRIGLAWMLAMMNNAAVTEPEVAHFEGRFVREWRARYTTAADKRYVADSKLAPCDVCTLAQVRADLNLSEPEAIDLAIWTACQPHVLDWYLDSIAVA